MLERSRARGKRRDVSSQPRCRRVRLVRALLQVTGGVGGSGCPLGMGSKGRGRVSGREFPTRTRLQEGTGARVADGCSVLRIDRGRRSTGLHGGRWTVQQTSAQKWLQKRAGRG